MNNRIKYLIKKSHFMYYPVQTWKRKKARKRCAVFQEIGYQLNESIHNSLSELGIEYFVGFGNLLGLVREGGFIEYDDDLDYIITSKSINWGKIIDRLKKENIEPKCFFLESGEIVEMGFEKSGIQIDFFTAKYIENNWIVHTFYRDTDKIYQDNEVSTKVFSFSRIGELEIIEINGSHFSIPREYDVILTSFYDENWRTPIRGQKHGHNTLLMKDSIAYKYVISKRI